jgi:elongation factor Ts
MSTQITTELVKELRDSTGVSVMQCKNALEESGGDMEKALIILKKKSSTIAMKKAERNASDGIVVFLENANTNKSILLTLHSETDFVARNNDFIETAKTIANIALEEGEEIAKEKSVELINQAIQKIGEKIELGNIDQISGGNIGGYVHGSKNAVVVSLEGGSKELARDIAMHIAAMKPAYINTSDIKEEDKSKVMEVFEKEVAESDKPEEIKKKILEGKISTYFKEQTLMEQPFIKDPNLTISRLLENSKATLKGFIRQSI